MTEREQLFYWICEAIQIRYNDKELAKLINPKVIGERKKRRRKLLDFVHLLEEGQNNQAVPMWHRAFETISESGEPTEKDIWILEEEKGFLIKIPAGSTTAQCLLLRELELLPKEKGL